MTCSTPKACLWAITITCDSAHGSTRGRESLSKLGIGDSKKKTAAAEQVRSTAAAPLALDASVLDTSHRRDVMDDESQNDNHQPGWRIMDSCQR